MTWSRSDLERVAAGRMADRERLVPIESAALAYARWQGLTDETGIDTAAAEAELEEALGKLDDLGPEGWEGLTKLANELGDTVVIGLMRHSLARGVAQVREAAAVMQRDPEEPAAESSKRRGKDKDR